MRSNRTPLYIIGSLIVLALIVVIAYAASQNAVAPAPPTETQNPATNSDTQNNNNSNEDAVQTDKVDIKNYAYSPAAITVKVGTKVTWTNQDSVGHTVTTQSGAPATISSGLVGKGASFSFTFDKAGTYEYYCEPHPYMKGTVIVTE